MRAALLILEEAWPGTSPDWEVFEYMSGRFFAMGLDLIAFSRVMAEPALARPQLKALFGEADFLVVEGGLNPNSGVSLKELLQSGFGASLAVHDGLRERLGRTFGKALGEEELDSLATVPESSLVLTMVLSVPAGVLYSL